jgi:hypothetical protein
MSTAFAQFDEPFAWLIRGLAEYGYADINSEGPITAPGSFDVRFVTESQGRSGLTLKVPAEFAGKRHHQDDVYTFEVYLQEAGNGFTLRCAECNFLADFAFDSENPMWAAGYIHQSLAEYIPEFVQWRLSGGELTWAQRQGIPTVIGEPCSASLATWITQQLASGQHFDGRHWGKGPTVVATPAATIPAGPIAMEGNLGRPDGTANNPVAIARALMKRPTQLLFGAIGLGALTSLAAVLNILVTIAVFGIDRPFALVTSFLFVVITTAGAVGAWLGMKKIQQFQDSPLAWVAIAYPAVIPVCCLPGLSLSIWAGLRWQSNAVQAIRTRG